MRPALPAVNNAAHDHDCLPRLVRARGAIPLAVVAVLALGVASSAHAQTPPSVLSARAQHARSLFLDGLDALDRGDAAGALTSLRQSFELEPRPIVMLNIAQALRSLGEPVESIEAFERYLSLGGSSISRERVDTVRATVAYLRSQLANATITSEPAGATVRVDGREVGRTPFASPYVLVAGEHVFELDLSDHVIVREHVTFAPGQHRTLAFRLAAIDTAATLNVSLANHVAPPGVRVALDGIDLGAPPIARQVDPGGHQLVVSAPGYESHRAEIVLTARQNRALTVNLARARPLVANPWLWTAASVLVAGVVAGAVIYTVTTHDPNPPDSTILVGPPR